MPGRGERESDRCQRRTPTPKSSRRCPGFVAFYATQNIPKTSIVQQKNTVFSRPEITQINTAVTYYKTIGYDGFFRLEQEALRAVGVPFAAGADVIDPRRVLFVFVVFWASDRLPYDRRLSAPARQTTAGEIVVRRAIAVKTFRLRLEHPTPLAATPTTQRQST